MKKHLIRTMSLVLVLCMALGLCTGLASAAAVSSAAEQLMQQELQNNGYLPDLTGEAQFVDAKRPGKAVTAHLNFDSEYPDYTVAVAVLAVDAKGKPLSGHEVRIIRGIYEGGKVTVIHQELGCRYFAMLPSQCRQIEDQSVNHFETTAIEKNKKYYDIYIETREIMSDWLANAVVLNKTDERLLNMRFTCTLKNDVLTSAYDGDLKSGLTVTDPKNVYTLLENETHVPSEGLVIRFKLNEDTFYSWRYKSAGELKADLQTEIKLQCSAPVTTKELTAVANDDLEIWSLGHLTLTYEVSGVKENIPKTNVKAILLPAKMDKVVLNIEDCDPPRRGGGGDRPEYADEREKDPEKEKERELAPIPDALNGDDHVAYIIGYDDGPVRPLRSISRAEVATICFRLLKEEVRNANMTQENDYPDVNEGQWFNCAISTMTKLGVVNGYPDGTFRPNAAITRAEYAAMFARFSKLAFSGNAPFSDIAGHWGAEEISIAYDCGWVEGYPNGTFLPDQQINRAEAMTLTNRVLHRIPEVTSDLLPGMRRWSDNMDESAWYYLAVQEATNSHDYHFKTAIYEKWDQLEEIPDWAALEK